jgi:hypothetical protein
VQLGVMQSIINPHSGNSDGKCCFLIFRLNATNTERLKTNKNDDVAAHSTSYSGDKRYRRARA